MLTLHTIPPSKIKDFCHLPLHKGGLGASAPQHIKKLCQTSAIIIITDNAASVVDNALLFIPFQTVKQRSKAIFSCKLSESVGFVLG